MKQNSQIFVMVMIFLLAAILGACGTQDSNKNLGTVHLGTTEELVNSGLLEELFPKFTEETGWSVAFTTVDSDTVMEMAKAGEFDALLMDDGTLEKTLIDGNFAKERVDVLSFCNSAPETDSSCGGSTAQYGILPLVSASEDGTPSQGAEALSDWLVNREAQSIIENYGTEEQGDPVFTPGAEKKLPG